MHKPHSLKLYIDSIYISVFLLYEYEYMCLLVYESVFALISLCKWLELMWTYEHREQAGCWTIQYSYWVHTYVSWTEENKKKISIKIYVWKGNRQKKNTLQRTEREQVTNKNQHKITKQNEKYNNSNNIKLTSTKK